MWLVSYRIILYKQNKNKFLFIKERRVIFHHNGTKGLPGLAQTCLGLSTHKQYYYNIKFSY